MNRPKSRSFPFFFGINGAARSCTWGGTKDASSHASQSIAATFLPAVHKFPMCRGWIPSKVVAFVGALARPAVATWSAVSRGRACRRAGGRRVTGSLSLLLLLPARQSAVHRTSSASSSACGATRCTPSMMTWAGTHPCGPLTHRCAARPPPKRAVLTHSLQAALVSCASAASAKVALSVSSSSRCWSGGSSASSPSFWPAWAAACACAAQDLASATRLV